MGKPVSGSPDTFSSGAVLIQAGRRDVEIVEGSQFITQTGGKDSEGRPLPARVAWRLRFRTSEGDIPWHFPLGDRKWVAPSSDGAEIAAEDDSGNEAGRYLTTVDGDRDAFAISKNCSTAILIRSAVELGVATGVFSGDKGLDADCLVGLKGQTTPKTEKRQGLADQVLPVFHSIAVMPGAAAGSSATTPAASVSAPAAGAAITLSEEHLKIGLAAAVAALDGKEDGLAKNKLGTEIFKRLAKEKMTPTERVRIKKAFQDADFLAALGSGWAVDGDTVFHVF